MAIYRLTKKADEDYESIFVYGILNFGLDRAETYASELQRRFEQIGAYPLHYPAIDHICPGYRLSVFREHSIYYRIDGKTVLIARILRNQNVSTALLNQE